MVKTTHVSLFDRLLGESDEQNDILPRCVRRHLEMLLNTRQRATESLPDQFPELQRSLYTYGLPDLSHLDPDSSSSRNQLRMAIEQAIRTWEPRLDRVRVLEPQRPHPGTLHFTVEARLCMRHRTEDVKFATLLQLQTGSYVVTGGARV